MQGCRTVIVPGHCDESGLSFPPTAYPYRERVARTHGPKGRPHARQRSSASGAGRDTSSRSGRLKARTRRRSRKSLKSSLTPDPADRAHPRQLPQETSGRLIKRSGILEKRGLFLVRPIISRNSTALNFCGRRSSTSDSPSGHGGTGRPSGTSCNLPLMD